MLAVDPIMDYTYTYFNRDKQRIYQNHHYTREFDVKEAYAALKTIPESAGSVRTG